MSNTNYPALPILVVDDEESICLSIDTILQLAGMNNVIICSDGRQVLPIVEQKEPSVILLDLNMPHVDGEDILDQIISYYPHIPVIIITGRIDAETAVDCMKNGAFDYIVKPVDENRLIASVQKSLRYTDLHKENESLKERLRNKDIDHPEAFDDIITNNPKMMMIFNYIESIATTGEPVLVRGETGTGKELIARAIHTLSGRRGRFVAVNVAGLDDNVFSDTLFGHVKGAFTGATSGRSGLIEKAAGGTLFLDEIGDLSPGSQIKLLRLLQEKEYLPIGADNNKLSDARIIASTHVDLWELQQKDLFRKDLHYRLRTHRITLPPLRDRIEDIPVLIEHFTRIAAGSLEKGKPVLPKELFFLLETYHFPGNIRELQAMAFDAVAQSRSSSLPLSVFRDHIAKVRQAEARHNDGHTKGVPFTFANPLPTIKEATRMLVEEAMLRAGNNQSTAAAMLGISQQALSRRLQKMDE
ncbi:sigma-54-dependent transcriptional regulator [Desulforhopalus singaporensis]|uniref:Two component, sigma54 specific, transcriptional regulator, Fis family n=1 Tax=Desulforhopalus singaporensis TaxID=91360 RepID=A0A1H0V4L6_9BACT|nr:sigma-54 dependent transcriptional regulator [Desulforhopalus singaporensis]SDP73108.1 two component, sigma54 specific, transcriptional regulator, Fis family [Desulforhopalus singaporensis]